MHEFLESAIKYETIEKNNNVWIILPRFSKWISLIIITLFKKQHWYSGHKNMMAILF